MLRYKVRLLGAGLGESSLSPSTAEQRGVVSRNLPSNAGQVSPQEGFMSIITQRADRAPSRRSKAVPQENTAHHEAGHVVAHMALGLATDSATIIPDPKKGSLGCTVSPAVLGYDFDNARDQRALARSSIIGSSAGMEAELLFDPSAPRDRGTTDDHNAFWLASEYGVGPRSYQFVGDDLHIAYLDRLRDEARRLMRQNWRAVEGVAEVLLKKKTLSREDLGSVQNEFFPRL